MAEMLFETTKTNDTEQYCVYCHRNKINGKRYIGQTVYQDDPNKRWLCGSGYKGSPHFDNAINMYGWDNFDHFVIQNNLTKDEADELEILNIMFYNTTDPNYGYNLRTGGSRGKHSEETKQKMMGNTNSAGKPNTKGYIWVNNSEIETLIPPSKTEEYIAKGYVVGPLKNRYSEDRAKKIGQSKTGNNYTKGRIWVSLGTVSKMIYPEYLQDFIDAGYVEGRYIPEESKVKMRSGSIGKASWNKGIPCKPTSKTKLSEANRDRKYMNNGVKNTTVKPEDIDEYLAKGWVIGRITKKRKKE